jgi:hypothetical protein
MQERNENSRHDRENQNGNTGEAGLNMNSAFIPDNPDFHPSKDVPQARGCSDTIAIIENSQERQ